MLKNDRDWVFKLGEFDVGEDYTLEIGYVHNFTILYIRIWHGNDFYVGTTLHDFENVDKINALDAITNKIINLPSNVYNICVKYAERVKNLQAFA